MSRNKFVALAGVATFAVFVPASASAQNRFHGLDKNRDGVITRVEWRGNDTSFRQHDSNRDGVIGGAEVRHVPAWDTRNNRWAGKDKPVKPAKGKNAKSKGKGKG